MRGAAPMRAFTQAGQQFGEYAVTIGLVATAFLGMQMVVSRRVSGALVGVSEQLLGASESGQSNSQSAGSAWTRERFDPSARMVYTRTGSASSGGSSSGYLLSEEPYEPNLGEGVMLPAGSAQQLTPHALWQARQVNYSVSYDKDRKALYVCHGNCEDANSETPDTDFKTWLDDAREPLSDDSAPSDIKSRRFMVAYRPLAVVEDEKSGLLYALVDWDQDGEGDDVLVGQLTDVSRARELKRVIAEWVSGEELGRTWDEGDAAATSLITPDQRQALQRGLRAYRSVMDEGKVTAQMSSLVGMKPDDRSKAIAALVGTLPRTTRNAILDGAYKEQVRTIDAKKALQQFQKGTLIAEVGWEAYRAGGALPSDVAKDLSGAPDWQKALVLGRRLQATLQASAKNGVPMTDDGSDTGTVGQAMATLTDELKKAGVTATWGADGKLSMTGDVAGADKKLDPSALNGVKRELNEASAQLSKDMDRHLGLGNEQRMVPAPTTSMPTISMAQVKSIAGEPKPADVAAVVEKGGWVDKDGDRLPDAKVVYGEGPKADQPLGPDNQPRPTETAGVTWMRLDRPGPAGGVGPVEKTAPREFFSAFVKDQVGVQQPEQASVPVVNPLRDDKLTGDEVRAAGGHPADYGGIDGWIRYEPDTLPKTATPIFKPTVPEPVHADGAYQPMPTGVPERQAGPAAPVGTVPSYADPNYMDPATTSSQPGVPNQPLPSSGSFGAPNSVGPQPGTTVQVTIQPIQSNPDGN